MAAYLGVKEEDDTRHQRSLTAYMTEALPQEDNYRNLSQVVSGSSARPTLDDLLNRTMTPQPRITPVPSQQQPEEEGPKGKVIKFGWIQGVMMRCMLNIWGVMLFLRVSWMVGQCGLLESLVIVLVANTITTITALSMSAVATNGMIKGGGVYYMISRSLGPEFGGSIGMMFTFANSIALATYIIGFVESLQDMLKYYFNDQIIDGGVNDIRLAGTVTLVLVLALAYVGMDWVTKVQLALLGLLILSQVDVVIGLILGPIGDDDARDLTIARGFVGFNGELFSRNVFSDYRWFEGQKHTIVSVFAVYFTAVTGIVAGANLSGDLKDPGYAIPKGTLTAIGITLTSYIIYPFLLASSVVRDASGDMEVLREFLNSSEYVSGNLTILDSPTFTTESCSLAGQDQFNPLNPNITSCEFGMENSTQVMELVAAWGPLIYLGCYAATLSSAIASLVGAPRVLQALAKDKIYPFIEIFAKGYGANNDPLAGYIFVFFIAFGCIMIGNLNAVSTLLTNFFLASYSLINFSCFHASFNKSPGWRPSFKYFNQWVSVFGALICVIVMFLIDYIAALGTVLVTVFLYLFVSYRKLDVNWGSSTQAAAYVHALHATLELQTVGDHVKNYRPQILVLSGHPSTRPALVHFANLLTKHISMLTIAHVSKKMFWKERDALRVHGETWLSRHKVAGFYNIVENDDLCSGTSYLLQLTGLGKLRPNMVLVGLKSDWQTCDKEELRHYFQTLHCVLSMQLALTILRMPDGLDYSNIIESTNNVLHATLSENPSSNSLEAVDHVTSSAVSEEVHSPAKANPFRKRRASFSNLYKGPQGEAISKDIIERITFFQRKQGKGIIDVWWLYDEGGLTLLLPYLITTRSNWSSCKLRIFSLGNRRHQLDIEQRNMAALLAKFRIDFDDVIVVEGIMSEPKNETKLIFEESIKHFRTKEDTGDGVSISDGELEAHRDKTRRHMRMREILQANSKASNLVVMTLPMPRPHKFSASLYSAWLDLISKDMPPFLFIRGNQQSVLTLYS